MPRVAVPVTTLNGNPAGIALPAIAANSDAANDHELFNLHDGMFLEISNSIATPTTVEFVTPGTIKGRAVADDTAIAIAASERRFFGPFDQDVYGPSLQINVTVATLSIRGWQLVQA